MEACSIRGIKKRSAGGRALFVLKLSHPQPVQIAVSIGRNGEIIRGEGKNYLGLVARMEKLALATLVSLEIYPFDIVFRRHGVLRATDMNMYLVAIDANCRHMLFLSGIYCVGHQLLHGLATAA